jgi:hypothetical protein
MAMTMASFFGREDSTLPDQPNGWVWDDLITGANITIRQAYERYVMGATLPPEVQYQRYFDATAAIFRYEGYSEKEIKWWFLRTGQGPKCYRQYSVGGACGLPPYDVWYHWYLMKQPPVPGDAGCFYVWADRRNADCYLQPSFAMYPPPGYRMPGVPCNTAGKRFDSTNDPRAISGAFYSWMSGVGPWVFDDLPELWGDSSTFAFSRENMGAFDATGVVGAGFCSDLEVDESAGLLHPVPLAYTVFHPSSMKVSFGPIPAIRGLPIGAMAMLDQTTNKQWPDYFQSRLDAYLRSGDWRTQYMAWPFALRDTLANFGVQNAALVNLSSKLIEAGNKGLTSYQRKRGPTNLMAGKYANVITMVIISFITMGVATAAMALVAEALVAAEVATAAEIAAVAETAQEVQTVYSVVTELQSDNPNLLSLAGDLLSLNDSLGLIGADVGGATAYDYSFDALEPIAVGGDQLAFDYGGENLVPFELGEASDLTGSMMTDALNEIDVDTNYSGVDFAGVAATDMQSAVENIAATLDQYAGDPNALYAAIETEAVAVMDHLTDVATTVVDEVVAAEQDAVIADILADNAECAAQCDMGALTVDELDMDMLDEGWTVEETTGMDYQQAVEDATPQLEQAVETASVPTLEEIAQVVKVAEQIAAVVEPVVVAPPPPPPPPPAPAQIVAAPAPTQPLPGPVATVTYEPVYSIDAPALDPLMQIQTLTAGFGPIATDEPIAPDGKKGFNLWWLLPLGLLALPLNDKRRTHKRGRKRK